MFCTNIVIDVPTCIVGLAGLLCVEMVPEEIQQEMKNLYCALCELLRHFWACFPTTTKALEDKVSTLTFCWTH